jgi:hypothetical protein
MIVKLMQHSNVKIQKTVAWVAFYAEFLARF